MPRITKESTEKEKRKKGTSSAEKIKKSPSSSTKKKVGSKEEIAAKKSASTTRKKTTSSSIQKAPTTSHKTVAKKKTSATKNAVGTSKRNVIKKVVSLKEKGEALLTDKFTVIEYYDLPYHYEQTTVKILAQTPTTLFIYWNISDKDITNFKKSYGESFFETTKPVLIVHNKTMNYGFEVDINDFANCWYLQVNDSKCEYQVELGRRPISQQHKAEWKEPADYVHISSSNRIESPNDHILIERFPEKIAFKDIKTNKTHYHKIDTFAKKSPVLETLYQIYALYENQFQSEGRFPSCLDLSNPTSGNPTSTFK